MWEMWEIKRAQGRSRETTGDQGCGRDQRSRGDQRRLSEGQGADRDAPPRQVYRSTAGAQISSSTRMPSCGTYGAAAGPCTCERGLRARTCSRAEW